MKLNYSHKPGVTLVELIIVVVIIGVISSLAITKFTQGDYMSQAREARLNDYAKKIAASAREARDIGGRTNIGLNRMTTGNWFNNSAEIGAYMTSLDADIKVYISYPNAGTGNDDQIWDFTTSDEVVVLRDEDINNVWLQVDIYGELTIHGPNNFANTLTSTLMD